jgi:hypothetical protein
LMEDLAEAITGERPDFDNWLTNLFK